MNTGQSLFNKTAISCNGSFLSDFVESFPDSSFVKDAHTKKYIYSNSHTVRWNGLTSIHDMIGITPSELWVQDILHRRNNLNLDSIIISNEQDNFKIVEKFEKQLLFRKRIIEANFININFNGLIRFEKFTNIPILDKDNKKIVAFLIFYNDLTHHLSLFKLFQLYQKYYPKTKSLQKMLEHLEIDGYFNPLDMPTRTEMRILFAMREDSRCKTIAQKFGYSVATANNHISNIQSKLKSSNLHNVLAKLRAVPVKSTEHDQYI